MTAAKEATWVRLCLLYMHNVVMNRVVKLKNYQGYRKEVHTACCDYCMPAISNKAHNICQLGCSKSAENDAELKNPTCIDLDIQ